MKTSTEGQSSDAATDGPPQSKEYLLKYPEFPHPQLFGRGSPTFEGVVSDDGTVTLFGQVLVFDPETPAPPPGTRLELKTGRFRLHAETNEDRVAREAYEAKRRAEIQAAQERADAERDRKFRAQTLEVNAALNIPVRWTSGQKSVLSGLTENSMGTGRYARSVNHVLLLEPIREGQFWRARGDFLCTSANGSNGKRWSFPNTHCADKEGRFVAPITCKACLTAARRWKDSSHRVEPELIPDSEYVF